MKKRSYSAGTRLPFYCSADPAGLEKSFSQLGDSLFKSVHFNLLTPAAQLVYLRMISAARGRCEFTFPCGVAAKYGISPATLIRSVEALCKAGFISKTACGRSTREPNVYRFSGSWHTDDRLI